jgi:serine/threonine-protein kinase
VASLADYELIAEIGRGGLGVVYKAREWSRQRIVALKMVVVGPRSTPESLHRFRSDIEAVSQLDHPNIVPVYEAGEHEGQPFFTMRLIDGRNLASELGRAGAGRVGPTRQRWGARLLATVARAVHHAHQHGILHRDLKPQNILLGSASHPSSPGTKTRPLMGDCIPYVTDFGVAKRLGVEYSLTRSSCIPPEQALTPSRPMTVASDVYALGAILYELLTDHPPFPHDATPESFEDVLHEGPLRPWAVNPLVDGDLELVCMKCLRKDPARRYGSALEVAEELERWLRGERVLVRPRGPLHRFYHWAERHPVIATVLLILFLIAVMFLEWAVVVYINRLVQPPRSLIAADDPRIVAAEERER